jgi:hypothetical protein
MTGFASVLSGLVTGAHSGSKETLIASEDGYRVLPAESGQFQTWKKSVEEEKVLLENEEKLAATGIGEPSTARLIRNFLDCIKSRNKTWCTLEEGHRSTSFAHLANIALAVGQRIE